MDDPEDIRLEEIMPQSRHRPYSTAKKYAHKADAWCCNVTQRLFGIPDK